MPAKTTDNSTSTILSVAVANAHYIRPNIESSCSDEGHLSRRLGQARSCQLAPSNTHVGLCRLQSTLHMDNFLVHPKRCFPELMLLVSFTIGLSFDFPLPPPPVVLPAANRYLTRLLRTLLTLLFRRSHRNRLSGHTEIGTQGSFYFVEISFSTRSGRPSNMLHASCPCDPVVVILTLLWDVWSKQSFCSVPENN